MDQRGGPAITRYVAILPMYDWPEERETTDSFFARFAAGLPPELAARLSHMRLPQGASMKEAWRHPHLLLGQACWGPLETGLAQYVKVVAQPDYTDVEGGTGANYQSAIVAQTGPDTCAPGPIADLPILGMRDSRFAFNEITSRSGYRALDADLAQLGGIDGVFAQTIETGSHRASLIAVAQGKADYAAIDCRSWALAKRHEPAAANLHVCGWTAPRLGLPYICGPNLDPDVVKEVRRSLVRLGAHPAA